MRTFLHDLRVAVRLLRQSPGPSTACIVTLALGIGAGLLLASNSTQLVTSMLFGIAAHEMSAFVAAPVAILVVAGLASYLPVRRATRVSPLTALRVD